METAKIKRVELVELTIPAGSTGRVKFNTIPQLRNQANQYIVIQGIELFTINTYASSQVTNNIPGVAVAEISKAVLVLYVNGEESIHYIPLAKLVHENGANFYTFNVEDFDSLWNVDFDKSYVQFSAASAGAVYVMPFLIKYLRLVRNPNTAANQPEFIGG